MRMPSRQMHDTQSTQARLPLGLRLLPTIILALLAWTIAQQPMLLLIISVVTLLVAHQLRQERNHLRALAAQRQGESICQFARAFPRRQVDTWVLRAVYESLHGYLGGRLPIRADDRLKQDLRLDDDDLARPAGGDGPPQRSLAGADRGQSLVRPGDQRARPGAVPRPATASEHDLRPGLLAQLRRVRALVGVHQFVGQGLGLAGHQLLVATDQGDVHRRHLFRHVQHVQLLAELLDMFQHPQ